MPTFGERHADRRPTAPPSNVRFAARVRRGGRSRSAACPVRPAARARAGCRAPANDAAPAASTPSSARPRFGAERGRTREHRRPLAAAHERDARARRRAARSRRARGATARSRALSPGASTAAIDAESSSSTTRCSLTPDGDEPRAGEDQRERQRGEALEQQAGGDRQLRDPAAALRRLPHACQRNRPAIGRTGNRRRNRWMATIAGMASSASRPSGVAKIMRLPACPRRRARARRRGPASRRRRARSGAPTRRAARDSPSRSRLKRAR